MVKLLREAFIFVAGLVTLSMATTPAQSVKDSMSGNLAVINGQKRFISGMNLAWINFGSDAGDKTMDINSFTDKVKQIRKAGGNAMRWWIHTDASNCPKIDPTTGVVTGLGSKTIKNMTAALDTAYAYGVVVSMCLFSFDLLVPGDGTGKAAYSSFNLNANYKFLIDTNNITTYLQKGLKPILDSVGSHPAVLCWEVFNEPEGMLASANWQHVKQKVTQNDILRITNRIAGFVHRNSKKMVSTGIASFGYISEYSDSKLKAAGGDNDGYLDFYMAHYYPEWQDQSISPFHNPASTWKMDRPILIGEFPAKDWSTSQIGKSSYQPLKTSKTIIDAYNYAYTNGYAGAMSWAMTESDTSLGNYSTTAPGLTALFNGHKSDIMIKDINIPDMTGDYAMKVDIDLPSATYPEAEYTKTLNFSGYDSLLADIYLPAGSSTDITFQLVTKSTGWNWCPSSIAYIPSATGTWLTYSVPISSFASYDETKTFNLAEILQVVIQMYSEKGFKGSAYIDNVRYKKGTTVTTISDFNTTGTAWSEYEKGTNDNIQISLAPSPQISAVNRQLVSKNGSNSSFTLKGKMLIYNSAAKVDTKLNVINLMGKTVMKLNATKLSGITHSFDLSILSSGHYILEERHGKTKNISNFILQ